MEIITYQEEIPSYALSYLFNADSSGLELDEIREIDLYMGQFEAEAEELGGHVVIDVISDEGGFTSYPAFGLSCDTYTCNINILY